jgi:predicted small integral membrane protein
MFEWMAWTTPVAVFFTCIVLMLVGMTVWEIKSPTTERARVFCPLPRRVATGFSSAFDRRLHQPGLGGVGEKMVQWFSLEAEPTSGSALCSMAMLALVMRKG